MRIVLALIVLALLAFPAFGTIVDNGDGTATSSQKSPTKFYTGFCAEVWLSGRDCSGEFGFGEEGKTFVQMGVCTQQEADDADPLPTNTCTNQYVTLGICPPEWHDDLNNPDVVVPAAQKCAMFVDHSIKLWGKARAQAGLGLYEAQRAPDPGDTSGEIVDP